MVHSGWDSRRFSWRTLWFADNAAEFEKKAATIGILATENEDVRSLRELLTYGVKGMAAYAEHRLYTGLYRRWYFCFYAEKH